MLWLNGIYIYIYIYTHNNNNNNNNNSTFNTQRERDIWGTGTISIINEYQSAICEEKKKTITKKKNEEFNFFEKIFIYLFFH